MRFEDFARDHVGQLLSLGMVVTGNQSDAEDFAQDALARIFTKWPTVSRANHTWAYARRVAINVHINKNRKLRVKEILFGNSIPEQSHSVLADDDYGHLINSLLLLPPRQRTIVVLRYFEEMSTLEIAAELGVGESTVRSSLSRALATLRIDHVQGTKEDTNGTTQV